MEKIKSNKYLHALFVTFSAAVLFAFFMIVCRITPFGKSTWLVYDMKRQYADFFSYYKTILSGDNNIFYSPAMTLGSGAVGFFTYYLTSPFLLLLVFFDATQIPTVIMLIIGLKLSLAAGSCDLFLKHYIKNDRGITYVFALTYAFCAYMISNSVNPMWLDVYMMMPIVLWMLDRLIEKKAKTGYILSLAYIIWCNYYIAFMVCIFIVMWSFYRLVMNKENFIKKLFTIAICSFWAAALDAVLLLPSVVELSGSPKDIFQLGLEANKGNKGLREVLSKLWFLTYDDKQALFGTPLIYMGVAMIVLTILYYTNKRIRLKEKACMAVMMFVFIISFMLDKINLLWHGGMDPSGYPYREAYMFVFLCIICSCKCFNCFRNGIDLKYLLLTAVVSIALLIFTLTGDYQYINKQMAAANIILLCTILGMFFVYAFVGGKGRVKQNKNTKLLERIVLVILAFIQIGELAYNSVFIFKEQTCYGMNDMEHFASTVSEARELIDQTRADESFFRMENMRPREQNDGMMYDYNGVTHYSSAGTIYTRFFLKDMGYNDDRLYTHFGRDNTCTADSILGIKYLIHSEGVRDNYTVLYGDRDGLVENPYALSLAFAVTEMPNDERSDPFGFQEKIYSDIVGRKVSIFDNAIKNIVGTEDEKGISNEIFCECASDGYVYLYLNGIANVNQNITVYVNGEFFSGYGNLSCMKVLNLGYHQKGQKLNVTVSCDDKKADLGKAYIVTENLERLSEAYNEAKTRNVLVERKSSSKYTLIPPAVSDETQPAGIITTIPYNDGWRVTVNGQEIEKQKIYNTFLYIPVTGSDTIEISYIPEGMIEGAIISLIAILGIVLLRIMDKREEMQ